MLWGVLNMSSGLYWWEIWKWPLNGENWISQHVSPSDWLVSNHSPRLNLNLLPSAAASCQSWPRYGSSHTFLWMIMAQLFLRGCTLHYHPSPIWSLLYRSSTILPPIRRASTASRKQVTVVNDDGRVRWGELTATEKIARTTQKTFHFGIVVTGMVMTVGSTGRSRASRRLHLLGRSRILSLQRGFCIRQQDKTFQ